MKENEIAVKAAFAFPHKLKASSDTPTSHIQNSSLNTAHSGRYHKQPIAVLRGKDVDSLLGISRSARYDKLNPRSPRFDPTFPKPIKLGLASIGFVQSEIDGWVESRIRTSRDEGTNRNQGFAS
jgi:prophage regulatory protein